MLSGDGGGPLAAVLPDGKTVEDVLLDVDTSKNGTISFAEFKAYLLQPDTRVDAPPVDADEQLLVAFRRLAPVVGRPEAECVGHATRLAETHWLLTVGDLRRLESRHWTRLELPLKLEVALQAYVAQP